VATHRAEKQAIIAISLVFFRYLRGASCET
jgi:hypothetical protein